MSLKKLALLFSVVLLWVFSPISHVLGDEGQHHNRRLAISFVEFLSLDLEQDPPVPLTVKGKLKLPARYHSRKKLFRPRKKLPAVVILHGSAGVDSRGDFYARALNAAGIATLEIDMWEARGITGGDRPSVPLINYPDAFAALAFLSEHPNIDPDRIGEIGFSWGGVVTMASATELYASQFGGELRFAAHVAHYPICYAYNNPLIPGSEFSDLTGAPLLIQIGEEDDYDDGSVPCFALKDDLTLEEQAIVEVTAYDGAFHGWDRLQVPITVVDPFAHLGLGGEVEIAPDVAQAYESRRKVVRFFRDNL